RRIAPRLVIYPGPAPRLDPGPVAIAIRRPVGSDLGGIPDLAVVGCALPVAVLIQVVVADHIRRNITARYRMDIARIAHVAEAVEIIRRWHALHLDVDQRGVVEAIGLPGIHRSAHAIFPIHGAGAFKHGDHRAVSVGVDIHAIGAWLAGDKGHGRRVYLVGFTVTELAHPQVQGALRQLDLGSGVIQI